MTTWEWPQQRTSVGPREVVIARPQLTKIAMWNPEAASHIKMRVEENATNVRVISEVLRKPDKVVELTGHGV